MRIILRKSGIFGSVLRLKPCAGLPLQLRQSKVSLRLLDEVLLPGGKVIRGLIQAVYVDLRIGCLSCQIDKLTCQFSNS